MLVSRSQGKMGWGQRLRFSAKSPWRQACLRFRPERGSQAWNSLESRGPKSVKVCALVNKQERQEFTPEVHYLGFQIPKGFLVGYGLDWAGKYRDLPGVYEVPEE